MTYEATHNAIRKKFKDMVAGLSGEDHEPASVQYDNGPEPAISADKVIKCRFQVLPANASVLEIGTTQAKTDGLALVSIFVRAGKGDKLGLKLADEIVTEFKQGDINHGGAKVEFLTPTVNPIGRREGWHQINVVVPWWTWNAS